MLSRTFFACTVLMTSGLSAAPAITSVLNAASNISPALPNGPIAPGSIFIVKGTGLGPANISIAPAAFQSTALSGTSVSLSVNGTTVNALMYYTSDKQIAALLPSSTPTAATGTITVTYNGQASPATPFRGVTANNLGIFTVTSDGAGVGIVTYADYSLVSSFKAANCGGPSTTCGAANPGDTLILWATGLGAVTGNDASGAGLGVNMPNLPLTLYIGGAQAKVIYQGRSGCCVGEDQIVFTVPDDAPTGCAVPLVVQINNQISNGVKIPIAKGSRSCSPTDSGLEGAVGATAPLTLGILDFVKRQNGTGFEDNGHFLFARILNFAPGAQPFFATYQDSQPANTCRVINSLSFNDFQGVNFDTDIALIDAGSTFTVRGPNGSVTVTPVNGERTSLNLAGTFLVPGDYTETGAGGKDAGPITATLNIPILPTLTSPVSATNLTVTRSRGMTVTWNANGSAGFVEFVLQSATDAKFSDGAVVDCKVSASAGTFTIPAYVMLALPAGNFTQFDFSRGNHFPATSAPFKATGISIGSAVTFLQPAPGFSGFTLN